MNQETLTKLLGEWVGEGGMTVGDCPGVIKEYLNIEHTDLDHTCSYIRKSSIDFTKGKAEGICDSHAPDIVQHNELGYITAKYINHRGEQKPAHTHLMLSRSSYIIMSWSDKESAFIQNNKKSSDDSKDMKRTILVENDDKMVWENVMNVDQGRRDNAGKIIWVPHTVSTVFIRIN